jgi:hypothetical protein
MGYGNRRTISNNVLISKFSVIPYLEIKLIQNQLCPNNEITEAGAREMSTIILG